MMPDVVYSVRPGHPEHPETLRYSLRSLINVPHNKVFVVGHKPKWLSDQVIHIPTRQLDPNGDGKFFNIGTNLQAAVLDERVSNDFYWFNDDFFVMRSILGIPTYGRPVTAAAYKAKLKMLGDINHDAFVWGIWTQCDMMERLGYRLNETPFADCHYPMPLNKEEVQETIEWMQFHYPRHPIGHFRAVYAAMHNKQVLPVPDAKVASSWHSIMPGATYVSTYEASWNGRVGREIRQQFRKMSPYERYDG